jgi:hypothetical protein
MKAGIMVAACAGLPSTLAQAAPGLHTPVEPLLQIPPTPSILEALGYYDKSAFTPYVNTKFKVNLSESNIRKLILKEVSDYLYPSVKQDAQSGFECFSLLFTTTPGKPFQQDTYLIEHGALGTFYMFVVPVSESGKKNLDYYESVIFRQPLGVQAPISTAQSRDALAPATPRPVWIPWHVSAGEAKVQSPASGRKTKVERDIYKFSSLGDAPPADAVKINEKPPAPVRATWLTMAEDRGINGLRLGMTTEQVLAFFPGSKVDEEVRSSLSGPTSPLGVSGFTIRPEKYSSKSKFDGISQIVFTLLDNRVSTLYAGYNNSTPWRHVDDFITKFSKGTKLPPADSWEPYVGMDDQLKSMKCKDYEIKVFAGGENVSVNYVQLVDLTARQKLKERRAEAKRKKLAVVKQ